MKTRLPPQKRAKAKRAKRATPSSNGHAKTPIVLPRRRSFQSFAAGSIDRLSGDWGVSNQSANTAIANALQRMRSRSRALEQDDSYAAGYGHALTRNVLGSDGIRLQMRCKTEDGDTDKEANDTIELAWKAWGENRFCDVTRVQDWLGLTELILKRVAADGEILIELIDDDPRDNPFGFSLGLLEADHLEETHNEDVRGGGQIRMGVETDSRGRPVRYHVLISHPGESRPIRNRTNEHRRQVEAAKMIHAFIRARPAQIRGVPWLHPCMRDLKMLAGYREAELVAARVAASKAGFFTKQVPNDYTGPIDTEGRLEMEVEPGMIEDLPVGVDFKPWDPTHPSDAFGEFSKSTLRGIAASLGISYTTLASDLEGVNYSSIRAGLLDERDGWRKLQSWFISTVCRPVFRKWLRNASVFGALKLPYELVAAGDYDHDTWRGRRWTWVDPEKDIRAELMAVDGGLKSRRRIAEEMGPEDFEDILTEISEDNELAKEAGVVLSNGQGTQATAPVQPAAVVDQEESDDTEGQEEETPQAQPTAQAVVPPTEEVQKQALNGAQVQALQQVIQAVAQGQLPPKAAKGIIMASFPTISEADVDAMVNDAASFTPEPEEPAQPESVAKPDGQNVEGEP